MIDQQGEEPMIWRVLNQPSAGAVSNQEYISDAPSRFGSERAYQIPVEVQEQEDRYELVAEVPGVKKEDLRISLENGRLTITGDRKPLVDATTAKLIHSEIPTGTFSRSFRIPKNVETGKLNARLSDGFLTLTMPKAEHSLPREIVVK
jgi:HSP20 family protein